MKSEWIKTMLVSVANNTGMDSLFIIIGKSFMNRRKSKCPTMFKFRQVRKGSAVMLFIVYGYSFMFVIQARIVLYYQLFHKILI
jgi:hypothetical protein